MGEAQTAVIIERLKRKFGAAVATHTPKVPYKETIRGKTKVHGRYKKQTGGHGMFGDVWLELEPNPDGGVEFAEQVVGGAVPKGFFAGVEKGIREAAAEGVLAGLPALRLQGHALRRLVPSGRLERALVQDRGLDGAQGRRPPGEARAHGADHGRGDPRPRGLHGRGEPRPQRAPRPRPRDGLGRSDCRSSRRTSPRPSCSRTPRSCGHWPRAAARSRRPWTTTRTSRPTSRRRSSRPTARNSKRRARRRSLTADSGLRPRGSRPVGSWCGQADPRAAAKASARRAAVVQRATDDRARAPEVADRGDVAGRGHARRRDDGDTRIGHESPSRARGRARRDRRRDRWRSPRRSSRPRRGASSSAASTGLALGAGSPRLTDRDPVSDIEGDGDPVRAVGGHETPDAALGHASAIVPIDGTGGPGVEDGRDGFRRCAGPRRPRPDAAPDRRRRSAGSPPRGRAPPPGRRRGRRRGASEPRRRRTRSAVATGSSENAVSRAKSPCSSRTTRPPRRSIAGRISKPLARFMSPC